MPKYRVFVNEPFLNCERVYPIQQKKVAAMVSYLKDNSNVKYIMIFGSSVTDKCHTGSDVDIYVELDKEEKVIDRYFPFVFDLWTNFTVDEKLKKEINKKGVLVYERKRNIA